MAEERPDLSDSVDGIGGSSSTGLDGNLISRVNFAAGEIKGTMWGVLITHTRWSRKRMMQACILVMAVIGGALGIQHTITMMSTDNSHLHPLQVSDALQATSRASAPYVYRRPQLFRVGGPNAVWVAPSTPDFFTSWAEGINFRVGDVLRFAGASSGTYLYQVSATNYASCQTSSYVYWWALDYNGGTDLFLQLLEIKTFYFVPGEDPVSCTKGLKIAATVSAMNIPVAPPRPNVNVSTRQPRVFKVGGDSATWTLPSATKFYEDWASNISFIVGDSLSFTLSNMTFEVVTLPYTSYETCIPTGWIWYSQSSTTYQFTTPGIKYFAASTRQYCVQGMRFTANVYDTGANSPPSPPQSKKATAIKVLKIIGYVALAVVVLVGYVIFCGKKESPPAQVELPPVRADLVAVETTTYTYAVTASRS